MDALDPIERLPRRERILRAAAMQEVVEQIHRDQRQREEQRGQQQGSQAALQRRGSTATKDKTSTGNRQEASDRDSGEPPPGKMQASQPSDGQPSSSAQTRQQRQCKVSGARQPEARPARPEQSVQTETASNAQQPQHQSERKADDPRQQLAHQDGKQRRWRPWWWYRQLRHKRQRAKLQALQQQQDQGSNRSSIASKTERPDQPSSKASRPMQRMADGAERHLGQRRHLKHRHTARRRQRQEQLQRPRPAINSQVEAPDNNNTKEEADRTKTAQRQQRASQDGNNWRLVAERSKERTRAMQQRKASTAADRQGGDNASASAAEPAKTTCSTTQRDEQASQSSSASARTAANMDKGENGDTGRSTRQQGHKPSSSARLSQPQNQPKRAKAQQGDIVLVDLDEEDDSDANKADESDQGGEWRPALQSGKRWRRRTLTHRLESQRDGGDKSTGSGAGARRQRRHVEPQGDARRGPSAKPKSK